MPTLLTIIGPTAVGKTELAIQLAQHFDSEIISADSRQFYREMSIGTAKPTTEELKAAVHHFIDSHSVAQDFSVGDFEKQGIELLTDLFKRKNFAILVGGSGLYINAITQGFDALPKASQEVRDQLNRRFETEGLEVLQHQLSELDPDYFSSVDTQNPQRLIRALEVCLSTGKTFSELRTKSIKQRPFDIVKIGLNMDRQKLYDRINQRVDLMMDAGLLEEVRTLLPYRDKNALRTVGYQELYDYLDGKCSLEQAVEKIKQNTRNFAKRQLTWFRRDTEITWFEPQQTSLIIQTIEQKMADNN